MVGVTGLEPATTRTPNECPTPGPHPDFLIIPYYDFQINKEGLKNFLWKIVLLIRKTSFYFLGSVNIIFVHLPYSDSAQIVPLCFSIMFFVIERPRPLPGSCL